MKRLFDALSALVLLVCMMPLILTIALLVRVRLGSPVLFRQQRPGLLGRPFNLCKFRTMSHAMDANGELLPDEKRLGRFGEGLRQLSLDELPQLWNVLVGDMSLVGPRPLLMRYLTRYSPRQSRRHEVRPGITGWAQINGRNALSWEEKFELDVWYVEHQSFLLDLQIIGKTAARVFARQNVNAAGHATMPEFFGEKENS